MAVGSTFSRISCATSKDALWGGGGTVTVTSFVLKNEELMNTIALTVQRRERFGKQIKALRRAGKIPAVLYGKDTQPIALTIDEIPFQKAWHMAGESSLIDVQVGDHRPVKALIQDLQFDPASGKILHVDLHQVNMKEKIEVEITLHFEGESAAVKELGGTLVKDHDTIKVECLPQDLVRELPVDLAALKTFDEMIRIHDIPLPPGLTLLSRGDDILAHVEAPRTEEELAKLDEAVEEDVSAVEKVEKPATEEEAAESSARPAADAAKQTEPASEKKT